MSRPYDVLAALNQLYKKFGWYGKVPSPKELAKAVKSGKWADGTELSADDIKAASHIFEAVRPRKPDPNSCPGCGGLMRDGACVMHITELCPPVGVPTRKGMPPCWRRPRRSQTRS
jgi:hypothetical protein